MEREPVKGAGVEAEDEDDELDDGPEDDVVIESIGRPNKSRNLGSEAKEENASEASASELKRERREMPCSLVASSNEGSGDTSVIIGISMSLGVEDEPIQEEDRTSDLSRSRQRYDSVAWERLGGRVQAVEPKQGRITRIGIGGGGEVCSDVVLNACRLCSSCALQPWTRS